MRVRLEKATEHDAPSLFDIQVKAFHPLLDRYKDYETNPANERIERLIMRINRSDGGFYKIYTDEKLVGAICIYWKEEVQFWISPMFILPSYQGKGIAQKGYHISWGNIPSSTNLGISHNSGGRKKLLLVWKNGL